jgi:hypothetical protein
VTTGRRAAVTLEGLPLCGLAAADGGTTALEWTPEALRTGEDAGANLVVRQAPAVAGVHRVGARRRFGLPGFLADSLPDAWGRLLVDRAARRAGLDPARLEGLDRLLIVGDGGPGALAFAPATVFSGEVGGFDAALDGGLDAIAAATRRVLEGHDDDLLDALARHGGSAGGTRPKVWLAVGPDGSLRGGAGPLAADETGYLVKFRAPAFDPPDIAVIELAYARTTGTTTCVSSPSCGRRRWAHRRHRVAAGAAPPPTISRFRRGPVANTPCSSPVRGGPPVAPPCAGWPKRRGSRSKTQWAFRGSARIGRRSEQHDGPDRQGVGVHDIWVLYPGYSPRCWGPHDAASRDSAGCGAGGQFPPTPSEGVDII